MTAKQRPVPGDLAFRRRLSEAFDRAVPVYFNGELLEGARRLPFGTPAAWIGFRRIVCAPYVRRIAARKLDHNDLMRRTCYALLSQLIHGFDERCRPKGAIPMIVTGPSLFIAPFNYAKLRWEMQAECRATWVDPRDWPTAPPAFPETLP